MPTDWRRVPVFFSGTPTVIVRGDRTDVFMKGVDNSIYNKWRIGSKDWEGWVNLGGQVNGSIAAVSWSHSRIDLFFTGFDGSCQHSYFDEENGRQWTSWERLGDLGDVHGDICAVSPHDRRIELFARGRRNQFMNMSFTHHDGWSAWKSRSDKDSNIQGNPKAISRGENFIDIFVRGALNELWHLAVKGDKWAEWEHIKGATVIEDVAVASFNSKRLDVFVRDIDNRIRQKTWKNNAWDEEWPDVSGERQILSSPAAVGWKGTELVLAYMGLENQIYYARWTEDEPKWDWTNTGGISTALPVISPAGGDPPVLFHRGTDGALYVYE